LAGTLPLGWCASAHRLGGALTTATSALVLVLVVVAAAATGDRLAGSIAAVSGAAWFDFFLTEPIHSFAIDDANDVEVAVLLVLVGAAVSEIALWGRRQQASSSARAGYLNGVMSTSHIVAGHLPTSDLINEVADNIVGLLDADACRFVSHGTPAAGRAVLEPDGSVTVRGTPMDIERDGLPTMEETALPVRHHGVELGQFLITTSTRVVRPTLEQRQVAVLLANVVGAETAARLPGASS
jgi:K+-sensing histidine kinase KdpD